MATFRNLLSFRQLVNIIFLIPGVVLENHYPDNHFQCKPCTKLKNTIALQVPLCVTDATGKFTDEGTKACQQLKDSCPEFNKGECVWYTFPFPDLKQVPCCWLKYMACSGSQVKATTWMEVYYTLQYPANYSDVPVYDIVEIHRKIKKEDSFGQRNQPDWPGNALDGTGERGLAWVIPANLTPPVPKSNGTPICVGHTDDRCSTDLVQYLGENFRHGFEDSAVPNISSLETGAVLDLKVTVEFAANCIDILVDKVRTRACQVLYVRHAEFPVTSDKTVVSQSTSFVFLEVNVYDPPGGSDTVLRYAYWFQEEPDMRDKIAAQCNMFNITTMTTDNSSAVNSTV